MQYAKLNHINHKILKIYDYKPVLFYNSNTHIKIPDNELSDYDIYPIEDYTINHDLRRKVYEKNQNDWIFDEANGVIKKKYYTISNNFLIAQKYMLEKLAELRYKKEKTGIIKDNKYFPTDRTTQSMINSAVLMLKENPSKKIEWKCGAGEWIIADFKILKDISKCIASYIEKCFLYEMELFNRIKNIPENDWDQLNAINLDIGWPSNIIM